MSLAQLDVVYLCSDRGISLRGTKGAAQHVREIAEALAARAGAFRLGVARNDGPEAAPAVRCVTIEELPSGPPPDLIVERYALGPQIGRELARRTEAAHWLEVNAPLVDEALAHRGLSEAEEQRERTSFAELVRDADGLLCVSAPVVERCRAQGAPPERTHLFPNGFSRARFASLPSRSAARRALDLAEGAFVVIFAGGFRPWHDLETLLGAFEALRAAAPESVLVLAGDGPTRGGLDAQRLARAGVRCLGHVRSGELPAVLAAADVGVAPNRAQAGDWFSPLKIAEYQAAGLAVVATDSPGALAVIQPGSTGLLVPGGEVEAWAEALRRLRGAPELREAMARLGQRLAFECHTWERRLDQFEGWLAASSSIADGVDA